MVYERSGKNQFQSIKNSNKVLNKLNRKFHASKLITYDFSTLYTTSPHNLIKKRNDLIKWTFHREGSLYLAYKVKIFFHFQKAYE